jgi:hypothetical protein
MRARIEDQTRTSGTPLTVRLVDCGRMLAGRERAAPGTFWKWRYVWPSSAKNSESDIHETLRSEVAFLIPKTAGPMGLVVMACCAETGGYRTPPPSML